MPHTLTQGHMLTRLRALQRTLQHALGRAKAEVLLQLGNRLGRVQTLGARTSAVEDGVATVKRERVLEHVAALVRGIVTRVDDPAVSLHKHSRAKVHVLVPPVRRARRRAARAENALVQAINVTALLRALLELVALRRWRRRLKPRLHTLVLLVEKRQVRHKVLDDVHVRKRVDLRVRRLAVNAAKASQSVLAVNVHGATAANALTARAAERERRVFLILDLKQRIKNHRARLVQVNAVLLHVRLLRRLVRVL